MAQIFETHYDLLSDYISQEREGGKRIVMCSGTFDLLHLGHMRLFAAAKKQGDILIVAVKSDRAASLKKEDPPVINESNRMETVAHIVSVDYVVLADYVVNRHVPFPFENTCSYEWLNMFTPIVAKIRPDCFVHEDNPLIANARKSLFRAYDVESIVNPRMEGISTTEIIDKIKTRLLLKMQEQMNK